MRRRTTTHSSSCFCAAVIRAVYKYQGLLRAVIASAGNDHRLGANEAPPAIISVFLGDQLTDVFEQIKAGGAKSSKEAGVMTVGVDMLPPIPKHAGRPETGRAPSPSPATASSSGPWARTSPSPVPLVAMNTIVAESLDYCATKLEEATGGDASKLNDAIQDLLGEIMNECSQIIFNGGRLLRGVAQRSRGARSPEPAKLPPTRCPTSWTRTSIALFRQVRRP